LWKTAESGILRRSPRFLFVRISRFRGLHPKFINRQTIEKMKKLLLLAFCGVAFASCSPAKRIIMPQAVNTINTAVLADLNLEREDYEILNTVTAEAMIDYSYNKQGTKTEIVDQDGEFSMEFTAGKFGFACKHNGILKLGYLQNDYQGTMTNIMQPEDVVRRLAIYRLVNIAREYGADAIIEPTVSTNVEQTDKQTITYKSTITAKIIKLKTDR